MTFFATAFSNTTFFPITFFHTKLFEMGFFGTVLILAILAVRMFFIHRLPKQTFVILWSVALLRLLLPFSIPSAFNTYSLISKMIPGVSSVSSSVPADTDSLAAPDSSALLAKPDISANLEHFAMSSALADSSAPFLSDPLFSPRESTVTVWFFVYCAGAFLCAACLAFSYIRLRLEFRFSLPTGNSFTSRWLREHPLRRTIVLRQSDCTSTPLTYGIFHPVILMPKTVDWNKEDELSYILLHEYTHIRRCDAVLKLLMMAALCIHWFNPFLYIMYLLFNRDIELACDENVIRQSGNEAKAAYALTLISMEEQRLTLSPFCSGFGKNAIEERITAIMKTKKTSLFALLTAALLITGSTAIFAVSAEPEPKKESALPGAQALDSFTEEEKARLLSLWIDGYQDMTIREFQNIMWTEHDIPDMIELYERYLLLDPSRSATERAAADPSGFAEYFLFLYEPLTGENWQSQNFDGNSLSIPHRESFEQAEFSYTIFLTILDADTLTVGEYDQTRQEAMYFLDNILDNYSYDELADHENIYASLKEKTAALQTRLSTERLEISVNYFFTPFPSYDDTLMQNIISDNSAQWDEVLSPYAPFGLTWEYIPDDTGNGLTMYYQNYEVRGICDPVEQIWITEHSGITTYEKDAIELYAVYEHGILSGLRPATEEEQKEWSAIRQQNSDNRYLNSPENQK